MSTKAQQFLSGARAAAPVILGTVPVGIAFSVIARQSGLTVAQTCGMSLMVFAGASQIMGAGMYAQGAGLLAIVFATFILNLRHLIMSTCVMNHLRGEPLGQKLLAAFGVTDETFAIFTTEKPEKRSMPFFLGLAVTLYVVWNASTLLGALASALLPAIVSTSLGISLYAMFIGMLTPSLRGNWRLAALAALTAVCNSVLTQVMDSSRALILSTLLCAFLGTFFADPDEQEGSANG